jgi:hypothetical protein
MLIPLLVPLLLELLEVLEPLELTVEELLELLLVPEPELVDDPLDDPDVPPAFASPPPSAGLLLVLPHATSAAKADNAAR